MNSQIQDLRELFHICDEHAPGDADAAEGLGVALEGGDPLEDQARRLVENYCTEITSVQRFEVSMGSGGDDPSLIIECDFDQDAPMAYSSRRYHIIRVLDRRRAAAPEVELTGADRDIASRFARLVIPELSG